jgi:hypothetical protein
VPKDRAALTILARLLTAGICLAHIWAGNVMAAPEEPPPAAQGGAGPSLSKESLGVEDGTTLNAVDRLWPREKFPPQTLIVPLSEGDLLPFSSGARLAGSSTLFAVEPEIRPHTHVGGGMQWELAIAVPAVSQSGLYEVPLTLSKNSSKESVHYRFYFTAGDQFVFPLATIILGVVVAAFTRWWTQRGKPQSAIVIEGQLLLSRVITRLGEIPLSETADLDALRDLWRELHDTLTLADMTELPQLEQRIEECRKKLENFETRRRDETTEIGREVTSVTRALIAEKNRGLRPTEQDNVTFDELDAKLKEIRRVRDSNELVKTKHKIEQLRDDIQSLRLNRARALVQRALDVSNTAPQAARDQIGRLCGEIRELMSSGSDDKAVFDKAGELEGLVTQYRLPVQLAATDAARFPEPRAPPEDQPARRTDLSMIHAAVRTAIRRAKIGDLSVAGATIVAASLTGMLTLYVGKNFGGLHDYITAFLWGLGVDNVVRLGVDTKNRAASPTGLPAPGTIAPEA